MKLGEVIKSAKRESGLGLNGLTPMSSRKDPYRLDTPANHTTAQWVCDMIERHVHQDEIHPRGLHYILVTAQPIKPNGDVYRNTDEDFDWLVDVVGTARWLGYIDRRSISDQRNDPPIIRVPLGYEIAIDAMPDIEVPEAEDLEPRVRVYNSEHWWREQPYTLIVVGEKSSLGHVVLPIALRCNAGVFLPTGDLSDRMFSDLCDMIEDCRRPAVVFYLSDFDPSGFGMPKVLGRKLQAARDLGWITQDVTLHDVALTLEQCQRYDLPSTPIKATDKRGPKWLAATGRQQTEIDALAALNPTALQTELKQAIAPYWDETLRERVFDAMLEYERAQTERLADLIGPDQMEDLRDQIADRLTKVNDELDELRRATAIDASGFDLNPMILPSANLPPKGGSFCEPVLDPADTWIEQTKKLMARKRYEV